MRGQFSPKSRGLFGRNIHSDGGKEDLLTFNGQSKVGKLNMPVNYQKNYKVDDTWNPNSNGYKNYRTYGENPENNSWGSFDHIDWKATSKIKYYEIERSGFLHLKRNYKPISKPKKFRHSKRLGKKLGKKY